MSYVNFQNLNQALAGAALSGKVPVVRRFFNSIENLVSMAKDLPTSWGRSYSGVMVLKYDQSGNPTDVTETAEFAHAIDVPNSIISDVKRRFNSEYADYLTIKDNVDSAITLTSDMSETTLGQSFLHNQADDQWVTLVSFQVAPNLFMQLGVKWNQAFGYKFSTVAESVTDGIIDNSTVISAGQQTTCLISSMLRVANNLVLLNGAITIGNFTGDTLYFDSSYITRTRANGTQELILPASLAPSPGAWNTFSTGPASVNNTNIYAMNVADAIGDIQVDFSGISLINSQSITDIKNAIDNL